jgi:predicted GNAT superfamily acetyltransferase
MTALKIAPVIDFADLEQVEEIQRIVWGMDDIEIIPGRTMHALRYHGACLLGAFDGERVVGFVLGVLGTDEGLDDRIDQVAAARLLMYSAILGVLPEYQTTGIGYRLKLAQREFALRIGIRLIVWTYDPLESRNAHFNIVKLGIICNSYLRNFHGEFGGINLGLPTDRFYVEWWVTSNRVQNRVSRKRSSINLEGFMGGGAVLINEASRNDQGLPVPPDKSDTFDNRLLLVEIPSNIQIIKELDPTLAQTWRQHTRLLFEQYFIDGYMVTDFVREQDESGDRSFYVLTRMDQG